MGRVLNDNRTTGHDKSPDTVALRQKISEDCEQQIVDFFTMGGQVVIYDAINGTKERRHQVADKFDKLGVHVVFLGTHHSFCR